MQDVRVTTTLPPDPYWSFNREERNAVAVLFGLLMMPGNLERFAELVSWDPPDIADAETSVEWSYLRDQWDRTEPLARGGLLLDLWNPANRGELSELTAIEFNSRFVAGPVSSEQIQSPASWGVAKLDLAIEDNSEFLAACVFKWAFRVKPDLVAQTPSGRLLCVEAKLGSREGRYPSSGPEIEIFKRRGLTTQSQIGVQRYLIDELLKFSGQFVYLTRRMSGTTADRSLTWGEALAALDSSWVAPATASWIQRMIEDSSD